MGSELRWMERLKRYDIKDALSAYAKRYGSFLKIIFHCVFTRWWNGKLLFSLSIYLGPSFDRKSMNGLITF